VPRRLVHICAWPGRASALLDELRESGVDVLVNNSAVDSKAVGKYEPGPARRGEVFYRISGWSPW
jgi:hypothetical protein